MAIVDVKELISAGVHFGHRASRWNPRMAPYIHSKRNLIHVIDLRETLRGIIRGYRFLARIAGQNNMILFIGTKRQAVESVRRAAQHCNMPFVVERWLGGTLTNFGTIRSRLKRLEYLETLRASGNLQNYSKKMISTLTREERRIHRNLEGIRHMDQLPGALVIIDPRREYIAVREANKLGIPVVALIDTDGDPEPIDIPIPGNDDAMRAVEIVVTKMADGVLEGRQGLDLITPSEAKAVAEAAGAEVPSEEPPPPASTIDEAPVEPAAPQPSDSAPEDAIQDAEAVAPVAT